MSSFFVQHCPTCGRRLHIRVRYLGKRVVCQHCGGKLIASDPASQRYEDLESSSALIRRANELLQAPAEGNAAPRLSNPR